MKKVKIVSLIAALTLLLCACGSETAAAGKKSVTDQACSLSISSMKLSYDGLFTGDVNAAGVPMGQGKFISKNGRFSYEGAWENGSPTTGVMHCEELPFTYGGTTYPCLYDGGATDCTPDGEGTLSYDKKNITISYTGSFDNGNLAQGHFKSNVYTLVLSGGQAYTGEYDGEWKDNCAHGYGEFICPDRNSYGIEYKGEWKYGLMDGQGRLVLNESELIQEGTFSQNEFYPTITEYFKYLQTNCSELLYEFPTAYEDLSVCSGDFKAGTAPALEYNWGFNYRLAMSYPEHYTGKLGRVNLRVVSAVETFVQSGEELCCFHAMDGNNEFYRLYLYGRHDELEVNDYADFYVLPVFVSNETLMKSSGSYSSGESKNVLWGLAMRVPE